MHDYSYSGAELDALRLAVNYYTWIIDTISPYIQGRCLEVGAGCGTVSRFLLLTELRSLCCLEPTKNLADRLQAELQPGGRSLTIVRSTLDEFATTTDERFDSIVCINVLEHIQDDQRALQQMRQLLTPNGCLSLFVPALPCLFGSLDVSFGHQRRYTLRRLEEVGRQIGLRIEKLQFFNLIGILSWAIMGKLLRRRTLTRLQVVFYDRFVIPIIRRLEQMVSPPIGQGLLLVMRKVSLT